VNRYRCDELFEIMTLKQTGKMNKQLPVVLFGKKYWEEVVNWQALHTRPSHCRCISAT
jgi:hypothetical protein